MSMILDALQRADRERQKQDHPLPSLDTPTTLAPTKASVPGLAWWLAGAGVVLTLVVALAFIALNRPAPPTVQSEPVTTRPAPTQEPVAAPQSSPESISGLTVDAPTGKPPAIAELYRSPQMEDESITELYRSAKGGGEPAPEEAKGPIEGADGHTQTLPERPEPAAVRLSEADPAPKQRPQDATTPKPDSATTPSTPEVSPTIASVRDLPWNLQQTMPSINYQAHNFRNGAASRVRINGKEYRAGERVAQDLTLERIEQDGAVMRYRGHTFKLQALNSWVNM